MKKLFILCALLVILFSCHSNDSGNTGPEKESYEVTKQALKEKELKNVKDFLFVTGNDKHNLLGQTVVKGSIANRASVAIYKDVDVQLQFFSKTGALLETDKEIVYETIHPGESKSFKTKYFAPKGSNSVALKILDAKASE